MDKLIDAGIRHAKPFSQLGLRQREWLQELFEKHFARMGRGAISWNTNHTSTVR
jgi:hypothetical protein